MRCPVPPVPPPETRPSGLLLSHPSGPSLLQTARSSSRTVRGRTSDVAPIGFRDHALRSPVRDRPRRPESGLAQFSAQGLRNCLIQLASEGITNLLPLVEGV